MYGPENAPEPEPSAVQSHYNYKDCLITRYVVQASSLHDQNSLRVNMLLHSAGFWH